MITATLSGDTLTRINGQAYTWATVAHAVADLTAAYPDSLSALEICIDGSWVASIID